MAKKKDEKDVLVVRDEKTGEISVVAGLNADGTPKRTPAKAENAQSFLQFDRHCGRGGRTGLPGRQRSGSAGNAERRRDHSEGVVSDSRGDIRRGRLHCQRHEKEIN